MINLDALMLAFCVCCLFVGIGVVAIIRGWYKHWNERWSDNEEDTEDTEEETDEAFAAAVQTAEIRQREEMARNGVNLLDKKGAKK